ncbi:SSI family serine proteinase inhibitor [Pseudarthrobacter sp. fls2-241-R2A-168]|uniref:SSI family serine proteinase inhibitor n=1 Tax=Pseudarthrobacter sp. fls2-241-R2A-168 TaxID=3040304 RepID=UPI002553F19A|nr:SSI family serine proteinase inhibitor [Pseudarthrobacter sp. fls2-241-R2A-168]
MTDRPRRGHQVLSGTVPSAVLLLTALLLVPSCSSGQGGGNSGSPAAPASSPASPGSAAPSGSTAPDAESTIPAPSPEPPAGPSAGPGQGNAELAITYKSSAAEPEVHYTLVCVDGMPDAESKHPTPAAACSALKENAALLASPALRTDQACTEQYGGPQEATVTGVVDGVPVDDAFKRTNGCEISAWNAAKDVIGASGGAA